MTSSRHPHAAPPGRPIPPQSPPPTRFFGFGSSPRRSWLPGGIERRNLPALGVFAAGLAAVALSLFLPMATAQIPSPDEDPAEYSIGYFTALVFPPAVGPEQFDGFVFHLRPEYPSGTGVALFAAAGLAIAAIGAARRPRMLAVLRPTALVAIAMTAAIDLSRVATWTTSMESVMDQIREQDTSEESDASAEVIDSETGERIDPETGEVVVDLDLSELSVGFDDGFFALAAGLALFVVAMLLIRISTPTRPGPVVSPRPPPYARPVAATPVGSRPHVPPAAPPRRSRPGPAPSHASAPAANVGPTPHEEPISLSIFKPPKDGAGSEDAPEADRPK